MEEEVTRTIQLRTSDLYTKIAAFVAVATLILGGIPFVMAFGRSQQIIQSNTENIQENAADVKVLLQELPAVKTKLENHTQAMQTLTEELRRLRMYLSNKNP